MSSASPYPPPPQFQRQFKSAHKRAQAVRMLLIVGAALNVVMLAFSIVHYLAPGITITDETTEPIVIIVALMEAGVALMMIAVYIATIVVFLMWMYRAYENLRAFTTFPIAYSSGWAVGSWFIPFVSLVVPYLATKELWNKSVPNTENMFSALSPPAFFPIWWTFWLLSNFASNAHTRLSFSEMISPEADAIFGIVTAILNIVAAFLAMKVVAEIDRQQTESALVVGQGRISAPPPPDMFTHPTFQTPTGA